MKGVADFWLAMAALADMIFVLDNYEKSYCHQFVQLLKCHCSQWSSRSWLWMKALMAVMVDRSVYES